MINIIHSASNKNEDNLIVFIHGFIGNQETWVKKDGSKPFIDLLLNDANVKDNFSIGIFEYHSKLLTLFPKARFITNLIRGKKDSHNLPINDICNLLESQLKYTYAKYDNIVLIGHSMGGLVAKRYILNNIKETSTSRVKLYVSIATPHLGSNLALVAKQMIKNVHTKDLEPLSENIASMNDEWVKCNQLPKRLYAQGSYDTIVPKTSSVSFDKDQQEIIYTDHDHLSIIKPEKSSVIVDAIIPELIDIIKKTSIKSIKSEVRFVDNGQYDEEIFVIKMLMADIHKTLMHGSKQAFFYAEFTTRKLNALGVNLSELIPLYEKIKELYIIEFGKLVTNEYKSPDELLSKIHSKIKEEDKIYLTTLHEPLEALQKYGMLHQLASSDDNVWWAKNDNISTLKEFTEKLKNLN